MEFIKIVRKDNIAWTFFAWLRLKLVIVLFVDIVSLSEICRDGSQSNMVHIVFDQ